MIVSKSFTVAGVSEQISLAPGQSASYAVSGTFTGTLRIEKSDSPLQSWQDARVGAADTGFTGSIKNETRGSIWVRLRASGAMTGTAVCVLADVDDDTPEVQAAKTRSLEFRIDGGGIAITTGVKGDLTVPAACTIIAARLLANETGSLVVDIWKDSYANFPPTNADTITASAKPTITAGVKANDATLTGWTTAIAAGDVLRFNVDSVTDVTRAVLQLTVTVP